MRCTQQFNTKCLKCGAVKYSLVRIGAFCMCNKCFLEEFDENKPQFLSDSENGKVYRKWLKKYLSNINK